MGLRRCVPHELRDKLGSANMPVTVSSTKTFLIIGGAIRR